MERKRVDKIVWVTVFTSGVIGSTYLTHREARLVAAEYASCMGVVRCRLVEIPKKKRKVK